MSDAIGPDGLTDEERKWFAAGCVQYGDTSIAATTFDRLGRERLAHAETRARAEKAEAERDQLMSIVADAADRAADLAREARALLGEVKP